jgi:hypothetical protein
MLRLFCRICPLFVLGLAAQAASAQVPQTDKDVVKQALWLKGKGQLDPAQELLSRWVEQHPTSELVATARAEVYLAAENPFWALKVLGEYQAEHPPACEARMFAARVNIEQANLDQAEALLTERGCERPEAIRVRRLLLLAEIAELGDQAGKAKQLVAEAETLAERYEEDDARLATLERSYDPYRQPLWTFAVDAGLGYTTTGMGQAPLEVVTPRPTQGSAMGSVALSARALWPNPGLVRPTVEFELLAVEQFNDNTHELSLQQPALHLGAQFGRRKPRLELSYGYDFVHFDLSHEDAGGFYSSAHRGEYRLDLGRKFFGFGQIGYRTFRDDRLSRVESEQGLRKQFDLSETLGLGLGTAVRVYRAEHHAFDQIGLTGFAGLNIQAPKGYELVQSLTLSEDRFPNSERFYAPSAAPRRELALRAKMALVTPERAGLRLSLSYEYAERSSSVSAYDFRDHRTLLTISYRTSHDEWRAKRIGPAGRVPMRHEKEIPVALEPERRSVREVLHQDEELRRNSSCLK